ncbi:AT-rich interactive domain-containing protein 2 [Abeliophyllum distichum]|uniref:AT-rich interactive domain-containing protein 2 n=1 Tax=Abeliophyllum distichum TaxID=126358 RepID=A0ABD1PES9_9LAMI
MKVDSTAVYNPNSLMYSSEADFFDNEGQEICWSEEGRELQNRKRSTYFLSLYTNPSKRKKVEDGYSFDPFQVVDPLNANDFLCWQAPPSQRADLKLVKCNKKWYGDILTSGGWLIDKKKQKMHPSMYSDHNGSERLRRSPRLLSAKDSCSKAQEKIDSESPSSDFQGDEDHSDTQSDSTSDSAGLCSNYHRNEIPIGPLFQADIPDSCGEAYDNDSNWVGTLIWPLEKVEANLTLIEGDPIGKGRQESCRCQSPGSVECVRFHVGEKRMMVKLELGSAFYGWKFDSVGEEVALSWTKEEEYKFQDIVKSKPSSLEKYIWDELFNGLPCKGRESLVSYYYNVFLLQRRGYQNRTSTSDIDSEDEESELGPLLNRFEQIAAESPESIFYSPKKSHLNIR